MLQLCVSQEISTIPFTFKATGIRVYSIEEALYHVYHYWRESVDDVLSSKMTAWIAEIGLSSLSTKMKSMATMEPFSKRMLAFLGIIDYFSNLELLAIKTDLETWEHRVEWEKIKDRADNLVLRGEAAKAIPLYQRALKYEENPIIINNMAVANMQLGIYKEAVNLLIKAHALAPDNTSIDMHLTEAAILADNYDLATQLLDKNNSTYLQGLMAYQKNDYSKALDYFAKAGDNNKIADTYVKMGQYHKALESLDKSTPGYHEKMADIYAAYGHAHMPEAIQHMKKAITESSGGKKTAALWTKLATYYRKDYDWQRADEAINNALAYETNTALLENTLIKKCMGRMRDYRASLGKVLQKLKDQYRT
ncbi:MAG: hypothetical protein FWE11_08085 [Defluviitaleaceae bacterium]|nr:hypothetical protein [Defluviitaleaceae bacterium]